MAAPNPVAPHRNAAATVASAYPARVTLDPP
jgi:hypothetical protein